MKKVSDKKEKRTSGMLMLATMLVVLIGSIPVHAAVETKSNAGFSPEQIVHKYVEGEQSISAATSFGSDSVMYTPAQTVHEPVEGEQSTSVPSGK